MKKITLQKNISEKTIEEGFKEFYRFCRVKNLSSRTLDYYQMSIDSFSVLMPLENQISSINQLIVEDYILHLRKNTNNNDTSINTKLKGLRVILYYFASL